MANSSIRITERDELILQFINLFGFCEIRHIQRQFELKKRQSYAVMKRLIKANLVTHQQIYHQKHGIYFVTKLGAAYTEFPSLSVIPQNHYYHHLTVIDVYQKLNHQYNEMAWVSERELINDKFADGVGQRGHIADGMVLLPDKKIAIEVELTVKGRTRLEKILKGYAKQADIDEIWYFCQQKTFNALQPFVAKMAPLIKTVLLENFLHG